tara:strand:+ start:5865 stop:6803 length:939 start_codon:yes stop_codon:yes gene_type:complete
MIQYIIAAGIGAFLGSRSKKSKKSYAEGGEIPFDIRGEVYVTFKDGREEFINVDDDRRFATNESEAEQRWMNTLLEDEDIEDVDGSVTATRVLDYEEGGYLYQESDDRDAEFTFQDKKEANEFIKEHNRDFETNYKSIDDFNKGEEYRKITKSYAEGGLLRVLKDSGFGHYKGTPENELKHNRGHITAILGRDNTGEVVHLSNYSPNTKRFLGSTIFDNPKKLAEYFDKNQIYAKGGSTYAEGGSVKMKHLKSHYKNLPSYSGYKWRGFSNGKHSFVKKDVKGYIEIEALEEDLTNGNIEFMAENDLSNTNR